MKSESAELSRQLRSQVERAEELSRNQLTVEEAHRDLELAKQEVVS